MKSKHPIWFTRVKFSLFYLISFVLFDKICMLYNMKRAIYINIPTFSSVRPSGPSEFHHVNSFKNPTTSSSFTAQKELEGTRAAGTF